MTSTNEVRYSWWQAIHSATTFSFTFLILFISNWIPLIQWHGDLFLLIKTSYSRVSLSVTQSWSEMKVNSYPVYTRKSYLKTVMSSVRLDGASKRNYTNQTFFSYHYYDLIFFASAKEDHYVVKLRLPFSICDCTLIMTEMYLKKVRGSSSKQTNYASHN